MATIRDLASSGECGQRSSLGVLAQHVTQTGQNALQEVRSAAAFGTTATTFPVHQELIKPDDLLLDHTRPGFYDSPQAAEFEQVFQGESRLVPFTSVDTMVDQFQTFHLPDAALYSRPAPPHYIMPNVWADQFIHSHPSASSEWVQQFQPNWADEFHSSEGKQPSGIDSSMLHRLQTCSNEKVRNSKFVQFLSRLEKGELVLDEENNTVKEMIPFAESKIHPDLDNGWSREFHAVDDADWAAEFPDHVEGEQQSGWVNQFYGSTSDDVVGEFQNDSSESVSEWLEEFEKFDWKEYVASMHRESEHVSQSGGGAFQYVFAQDNPYRDHADPMSEGVRLMDQGNLSNAILAFEAQVQRSKENLNAWRLLGQCNADNESDVQCIAALATALELDPYNSESLLMLGVSHTNDLDQAKALHALKSWIENNPDFQFVGRDESQFAEFEELYGGLQTRATLCSQILDMYTKAALKKPNDVDVRTVLGVLYNITGEYERAIECFTRATQLQPNDPRLWNKLGATQANGSQSLAAVQSYKRALELKPNYVRALANLGISFANQGMHREAAQTYLATLARNPNAEHIWSYLCITLASANCPPEICALADQRDVNLLRPYFDF